MKQPVNSALSKRILLQLNREPAESVSALAETLQAPRPSVSRAINEMIKLGLVTRKGRQLSIAAPGRQAARVLEQGLPDEIAKAGKTFARVMDQVNAAQALSSIGALQNTLDSVVRSIKLPQVRFPVIAPQDIMGPSLKFNAFEQINEQLRAAFSPGNLLPPVDFTPILNHALEQYQVSWAELAKGLPSFMPNIQASVASSLSSISTWFEEIKRELDDLEIAGPVLVPIFLEAGFWITPSMHFRVILEIKRLYDKGELTAEALRNLILSSYRADQHALLCSTVRGWLAHPVFAKHERALIDALEAHVNGKYTLTIPTLLAHIEGIGREIIEGKDEGTKQTIEKAVTKIDPRFVRSISRDVLLTYITTMAYEQTKKLNGRSLEDILQRHAILHGMIVNYNTEENSLRAFLLLDALSVL